MRLGRVYGGVLGGGDGGDALAEHFVPEPEFADVPCGEVARRLSLPVTGKVILSDSELHNF